MSSKVCQYCGTNPIAEAYLVSCNFCVFDCASCNQVTAFESGNAGSDVCDDCATVTYEDLKIQILHGIKNLERLTNDKI